jgi:hypothetical protein
MKLDRAVEMTDAWKTKENRTQVSLRFPQSLEIAARFPHFHRPTASYVSKLSNQTQERRSWRRIASLPPSGSFFNEKMLDAVEVVLYVGQFFCNSILGRRQVIRSRLAKDLEPRSRESGPRQQAILRQQEGRAPGEHPVENSRRGGPAAQSKTTGSRAPWEHPVEKLPPGWPSSTVEDDRKSCTMGTSGRKTPAGVAQQHSRRRQEVVRPGNIRSKNSRRGGRE